MAALVLLGSTGLVGAQVRAHWAPSRTVIAPTHAELDVLDFAALAAFLAEQRPAVVLNLVGWADVDGAEAQLGDETGPAYQLNAALPTHLAQLCGELNAHLVHVSTDYVFDGSRDDRPYREDDPTGPLCWYASTKHAGERAALGQGGHVCVARIEMPFTAQPHRKSDLARTCLTRLRAGQTWTGVVDQKITPLFLDDAVRAFDCLVDQRVSGLVHVAAADWTTPYEMAHAIARRFGVDRSLIEEESFARFAARRPAQRPRHSWLDVNRFSDVCGSSVLRSVDAELDAWAGQLLVAR